MKKNKFKKLKKYSSQFKARGLLAVFFSIFSFLLLAYAGKTLSGKSTFLVRRVSSNVTLDAEITRFLVGQQLFKVDIKKIYERINRQHPEYKEIRVIKEFPSSLRIEIKTRSPFAQLKRENFFLIDKESVVIDVGYDQFQGLPPIEIDDYNFSLKKGSKILDSRLKAAFDLIDTSSRDSFFKKFPIKIINVTNPSAVYFMIEDTRITLGVDFKKKLRILEGIVNDELRGNLVACEYIDLRYENAYIGRRR